MLSPELVRSLIWIRIAQQHQVAILSPWDP